MRVHLFLVGLLITTSYSDAAVQVDGIEVTQAIQDMHQSVALVAGKRTWVRVYLSSPGAPSLSVRGSLSVKNEVTGTTAQVPSSSTTTTDSNQPLTDRRAAWQKSLNFLLPATSTSVGIFKISIASLQSEPTHTLIDCGLCGGDVSADFKDVPPLRLHLIGLQYRGGNPLQLQTPRDVDFATIESWLRRAYPVGEIVVTRDTVPSRSTYIPSCNEANLQLAALRAANVALGEDRRTHYLGLVYNGGATCVFNTADPRTNCFMRGCSAVPKYANPAAIASTPVGPPNSTNIPVNENGDNSQSFGGWYGGHELAHSFGRMHPGYCNGNSTDDYSWPSDHVIVIGKDAMGHNIKAAIVSDNQGDAVGLDTGDTTLGVPLRALPGVKSFEIMSYCNQPQWLSDYTYTGVRERLVEENAFAGAPTAHAVRTVDLVGDPGEVVQGSFVHVVASVNVTNSSGSIEYVSPAISASQQSRDARAAELVTLRADGSVIAHYPVDLNLDSDTPANEPQKGLVDASVEATNDLHEIRLVLNGKQLASFSASQEKPAKPSTLAASQNHGAPGENGMLLSWNPKAAQEHLTYTIQVSDDKRSWTAVAVGANSPSVELNGEQRKRKFVRVIATNGFKNSDPVVTNLQSLESAAK